jgi:predicted ATPase
MAAKKTAYATASKYLQQALRDLEHHSSGDLWSKKYYEAAIELYGLYATAELSQGNFELGRRLAQQVLDHAVSTEDTLYPRLALALAFSKEGDHVSSKRVLVDALRLIDMYPSRQISVTWDLMKDYLYIRKYLKTHTDDDILSLPHLEEGVEYIGMQLLLNSADQSYYLGDPFASMVSAIVSLHM